MNGDGNTYTVDLGQSEILDNKVLNLLKLVEDGENLDEDIESYLLKGKEEEDYNQIENEEESKLQINNNNIFEKLKIKLKEKKNSKI